MARKFKEVDEDDDFALDEHKIKVKKSEQLLITISQLKKNRKVTRIPIAVHEHNTSLPSIPFPIRTFDDLFRLATHLEQSSDMYKDCQRLKPLYPVLRELNEMVGLATTKNALCNMILFELQNMPCYWRHMVITGDPGMGKTTVATIIAKLLNLLGQTPSDEITRGNPLNMISDYEGQTKSEVNRVVQEALSKSGVLLIDEAPALYDKKNRDSYGKKCLDMLMQLMDVHREQLIVIFAGYKHDMETNILQSNDGFRRRIQWYFHMDNYSAEELYKIFLQKIKETSFELSKNTKFNASWFQDNYASFPYFGGSVENMVQKIRIVNTRKTFGFDSDKTISDETIQEGFGMYIQFTMSNTTTTQNLLAKKTHRFPFVQ